ncbi:MAG: HlyC/CorC family transporter [Chitinispirillaceae bacterium]|nr:HlyC/CorC family transporter [Chitinispirillaceae bacterium]
MEGDPSIIILVVLLIVAFVFSSVFSIVKIVFTSIGSGSIPADDDYLRYHAVKIAAILENESLFTNTVSFGRTFSNISFSLLAFLIIADILPYIFLYQKILISLLFSLVILTLFAYDIPRALAKRFYRNLFPFSNYIYIITGWLFLPLVSLFIDIHHRFLKLSGYDERLAFLSDEEKARISEKKSSDALDNEEREMIRSIFELNEKTVDEIMVPRIDMRGFELDTPLQTVLQIVREEGHSRLPVFRETIDSIVGVLYVKDIVGWFSEHHHDEWNIKQLLKKPLYVPSGKKVNDLMRDFKKKHLHLAIVVDEYGGTAGLVTMEDILEEIVGDIQDEYDEEEKEVVKTSENSYLIDPHIDLNDLNDELGINLKLDDVEYNTLSGLIYQEYGDVPQENASFDYAGLHITILKMDNQRIEKVKVDVISSSPDISDSSVF